MHKLLAGMYGSHGAREDLLESPNLREALGKAEILELGEGFEEAEHRRFGEGGFEAIVAELAGLGTSLGPADQALFDPRGLLAAARKSGRFLC